MFTSTTPPWTSSDMPAVMTYVYRPPDAWEQRFQLEWDYRVEWPEAGRPIIKLLRYRSYQQDRATGGFVLAEEVTSDIPVNEAVMVGITKHAAGCLFAHSEVHGDWRLTSPTLLKGGNEASKRQFSLASFRQMMQRDPDPSR